MMTNFLTIFSGFFEGGSPESNKASETNEQADDFACLLMAASSSAVDNIQPSPPSDVEASDNSVEVDGAQFNGDCVAAPSQKTDFWQTPPTGPDIKIKKVCDEVSPIEGQQKSFPISYRELFSERESVKSTEVKKEVEETNAQLYDDGIISSSKPKFFSSILSSGPDVKIKKVGSDVSPVEEQQKSLNVSRSELSGEIENLQTKKIENFEMVNPALLQVKKDAPSQTPGPLAKTVEKVSFAPTPFESGVVNKIQILETNKPNNLLGIPTDDSIDAPINNSVSNATIESQNRAALESVEYNGAQSDMPNMGAFGHLQRRAITNTQNITPFSHLQRRAIADTPNITPFSHLQRRAISNTTGPALFADNRTNYSVASPKVEASPREESISFANVVNSDERPNVPVDFSEKTLPGPMTESVKVKASDSPRFIAEYVLTRNSKNLDNGVQNNNISKAAFVTEENPTNVFTLNVGIESSPRFDILSLDSIVKSIQNDETTLATPSESSDTNAKVFEVALGNDIQIREVDQTIGVENLPTSKLKNYSDNEAVKSSDTQINDYYSKPEKVVSKNTQWSPFEFSPFGHLRRRAISEVTKPASFKERTATIGQRLNSDSFASTIESKELIASSPLSERLLDATQPLEKADPETISSKAMVQPKPDIAEQNDKRETPDKIETSKRVTSDKIEPNKPDAPNKPKAENNRSSYSDDTKEKQAIARTADKPNAEKTFARNSDDDSSISSIEPSSLKASSPTTNALPNALSPRQDSMKAQVVMQTSLALVQEAKSFWTSREARVIRFRFQPEKLGEVEVSIQSDAQGRLSAQLNTDREFTHKTLNEGLQQLRRSLEEAGFQVERLDVNIEHGLNAGLERGTNQQQEDWSTETSFTPNGFEETDGTDATQIVRLLSVRA
jgi:hypothetical protein